MEDRTLSLIAGAPPSGVLLQSNRLLDMAVVIRSKDAGTNRLTFDIIFTSAENYEAALHSNVFSSCNIARLLELPRERMVGTFFVDTCNAIKISIERPNISGVGRRAGRFRSAAASRHREPQHSDLRDDARKGFLVLRVHIVRPVGIPAVRPATFFRDE